MEVQARLVVHECQYLTSNVTQRRAERTDWGSEEVAIHRLVFSTADERLLAQIAPQLQEEGSGQAWKLTPTE